MEKRTYTICNLHNGFRYVPSLKITGQWLKDKGFNVGDKLELIESRNMIILMKKSKETTEFELRKKEILIAEEHLRYLKNQI